MQGRQRTIKKVPQNIDFVGLVFLLSPLAFLLVIRLGFEPKTPTLKVLCSTS